MKKVISNVMLVAAAAIALFSCQKSEVSAPEYQLVENLFFGSGKPVFDDETKTEWTGQTIHWSKDDNIRVAYTCDGIWQNANGSSTKEEEEGKKTAKLYASESLKAATEIAKFVVPGTFMGNVYGNYKFYAIYP